MDLLKKKIRNEAYVLDGGIVKVDHFINHMLDTKLLYEIGKELSLMYPEATKIVTVEASGISFACSTAFHMNYVPVVFARKTVSKVMGNHLYKRDVLSFTKGVTNQVVIDKACLSRKDKVVVIDDFLAMGNALNAMAEIVIESGAELLGTAVVIEKGFQKGRDRLIEKGISVKSLVNIVDIRNDEVIFDE